MTDVGNFLIHGNENRPIISESVRTTKVLNYKDTMVSPHNTKVRGYGEVRILHVPPLKDKS